MTLFSTTINITMHINAILYIKLHFDFVNSFFTLFVFFVFPITSIAFNLFDTFIHLYFIIQTSISKYMAILANNFITSSEIYVLSLFGLQHEFLCSLCP